MIKSFSLAALAALVMAGSAAAQSALAPLTNEVKPVRMSGLGLRVSDIERSKAFYTDVLGFKVDAKVPGKDGKVLEYLLGMTGDLNSDGLLVLGQGAVTPGAQSFGRIVMVVPNGRAMAERVKAGGGDAPKIVDGTNIVHDPDGYVIELYQRPAPKTAS